MAIYEPPSPALASRLAAHGRALVEAWRLEPTAPLLLAPLVAHGLLDAERAVAMALAIPHDAGADVVSRAAAGLRPLVDADLHGRLRDAVAAAWDFLVTDVPLAEWVEQTDPGSAAELVLRSLDALAPDDARAMVEAIARRLDAAPVPTRATRRWPVRSDVWRNLGNHVVPTERWGPPEYREPRLALAELYWHLGDGATAAAWLARAEREPWPFDVSSPPAAVSVELERARVRSLVTGEPHPLSTWPDGAEDDPVRLRAILEDDVGRATWERRFGHAERCRHLAAVAPPGPSLEDGLAAIADIACCASPAGRTRARSFVQERLRHAPTGSLGRRLLVAGLLTDDQALAVFADATDLELAAAVVPLVGEATGDAIATRVLTRAAVTERDRNLIGYSPLRRLVDALGDERATRLWRSLDLPIAEARFGDLPPSLRDGEASRRLRQTTDLDTACAAAAHASRAERRTVLARAVAAIYALPEVQRVAAVGTWLEPLLQAADEDELLAMAAAVRVSPFPAWPWFRRAVDIGAVRAQAVYGEMYLPAGPARDAWRAPDRAALAAAVIAFVARGGDPAAAGGPFFDAICARGGATDLARILAADPSLRWHVPRVLQVYRSRLSADVFAELAPACVDGLPTAARRDDEDGVLDPAKTSLWAIHRALGPEAVDAFLDGVLDALAPVSS